MIKKRKGLGPGGEVSPLLSPHEYKPVNNMLPYVYQSVLPVR